MEIPKDITSTAYPAFIRDNQSLRNHAKQERIFQKIGLENNISNVHMNVEAGKDDIASYLNQLRMLLINEAANLHSHYGYSTIALTEFRSIIDKITTRLNTDPFSFISKYNGLNLILPFELSAYSRKYISNTGLFEPLRNIKYESGLPLTRMNSLLNDGLNTFAMLKKENLKLVFSGSGEKCLWDIATMSMRGITSCQKWDNPHARALIGTMIDPYAAIMYITDGAELFHGSNMLKRSVIRFIADYQRGTPAIMIERIYPHDYNGGLIDYITLSIFKQYIQKITDNKFPIFYGELGCYQNYVIPITRPVEEIAESLHSYRDSKISYYKLPKYTDVSSISV
jgi:hypothetical protein